MSCRRETGARARCSHADPCLRSFRFAAAQFDKDKSEELDYEEFRMYTMACESIESRPAHSLALAKKG